jgi:cell division protein FtsW (lipid II flippase)
MASTLAYSSHRVSFEAHLTGGTARSSFAAGIQKERADMLPFDKRPWAKQLAATVIVVTLVAAVCVPIILHQFKALDPPIVVGIVLLLLAIIPPNIVVLRQRRWEQEGNESGTGPQASASQGPRVYATRPTGR